MEGNWESWWGNSNQRRRTGIIQTPDGGRTAKSRHLNDTDTKCFCEDD